MHSNHFNTKLLLHIMRKINSCYAAVVVSLSSISICNAAISIRSSNLIGFDSTTAAITDNTGTALANGSGHVGVGSFLGLTDSQVQALSSGSDIEAAFTLVDSTSINSGAGLWDASLSNVGDTSSLASATVYTVIADSSTITGSTQFFIYKHASTFVETPSSNAAAIVDSAGYPPTLEILVGGYGNFQYDFGAGSFDAFNLVTLTPVPEPSSAALLGLGGLALLMRRRRESNL